jgi:exopolysaccharide biosynthesis protein
VSLRRHGLHIKRFEPTSDDCVFIYRTSTHEGIANCEGKKFTYPNWKEVRDTEKGLAIVKTTEGMLTVYNISTKAKILERPNQTHSISIASNGIRVYDGKATTLYDYSGKKIK